jgi:ABC-2 type transport system ATP-binding protein
VLRATGLTKRYAPAAPPALDALDLEVRDGEILFLLGANGAGKTTALNCFLDFTRPTAGRAEVDGIVVADEPVAAKRRCALVPENVVAYATLTARQNLRFFARLGGERTRALAGDAGGALARAGLPPASFDRPVREFSKGMRQKLGIAIAVARDAPNLLLDEPTSGLDPAAAADFMALLATLRDDGRAILMCTHDVFRAREYADRAAVMRAGRLVATIERDDLRRRDLEALYLSLMSDGGEGDSHQPPTAHRSPAR